jgi:hypothetical protein
LSSDAHVTIDIAADIYRLPAADDVTFDGAADIYRLAAAENVTVYGASDVDVAPVDEHRAINRLTGRDSGILPGAELAKGVRASTDNRYKQ